jgi:hypothetical protein
MDNLAPTAQISWKFILGTSIKICWEKSSLVKIGQKYHTLHGDISTFLITILNFFYKNAGCFCLPSKHKPLLYICLLGRSRIFTPPPSPVRRSSGPTWTSTIRARHQFLRLPRLLIFLGITKTKITIWWWGCTFLFITARHREQYLQHSPHKVTTQLRWHCS